MCHTKNIVTSKTKNIKERASSIPAGILLKTKDSIILLEVSETVTEVMALCEKHAKHMPVWNINKTLGTQGV